MTRFKKLKDWPECLERMPIDELRSELNYWLIREQQLGHRDAKKGAFNYARTIRKVLGRRLDEGSRSSQPT
jgi:hypothetical protein